MDELRIDRRGFLFAGSLVAFGPMILPTILPTAHASLAPAGGGTHRPSWIGYWLGSDHRPFAGTGRLACATRLTAGDPRLAETGVRLGIRGFVPAADPARRVRVFGIDAHVPDRGWTIRAWRYHDDGVPSMPADVSFPVPLDPAAGLVLTREAVEDSRVDDPVRVELTLGRGLGVPKLRSGTYVVAGRSRRTGGAPRWDRLRGAWPDADTADTADTFTLAGADGPADFPYVLLTVEPAAPCGAVRPRLEPEPEEAR